MKIFPHHILYPPHRRNSIGNVYAIRVNTAYIGLYLLVPGGCDDYGDPYVHLVNLKSGSQWTDAFRVADPHHLTDSEMAKILNRTNSEFVQHDPNFARIATTIVTSGAMSVTQFALWMDNLVNIEFINFGPLTDINLFQLPEDFIVQQII